MIADCQQIRARLMSYLDNELSADEMVVVGQHLASCDPCSRAFSTEREYLDCVRSKLAMVDVPAELLARIRAALDQAF